MTLAGGSSHPRSARMKPTTPTLDPVVPVPGFQVGFGKSELAVTGQSGRWGLKPRGGLKACSAS